MARRNCKFLAVACGYRFLSYHQAWLVHLTQQRYSWLRGTTPVVGEIATRMRYLSANQVTDILGKQQQARDTSLNFPDPLTKSRRILSWPVLSTPWRLILGLLVVAPILTTALISHWHWDQIANAASITAAVVTAIIVIFPRYHQHNLLWDRLVRFSLFVLAPISFGYALLLAILIYSQHSATSEQARLTLSQTGGSTWLRFFAALTIAGVCAFYFWIVGAWRRIQVCAHEVRTSLLRTFISNVFDEASRKGNAPINLDDLLPHVVAMISANAHARMAGRIAGWIGRSRAPSAISVWYLEPHNEKADRFHIKAFATSELVGKEVVDAYEHIQQNHLPVALDEAEFEKVKANCKSEAEEHHDKWKTRFLERIERSSFISLTGYVYKKRVDVCTGVSKECLAFDRSYLRGLPPEYKTRGILKWLDFQSFAACPIFPYGQNGANPKGVMIAFRNLRNGFAPEDLDVLFAVARTLSLAV